MARTPPGDPYKTLGVAKDADATTIKRAYRKRAKKVHPDAGGTDAEMAALSAAHAILSDPVKRLTYDRTGTVDDEPSQVDANAKGMIAALIDEVLVNHNGAWHVDVVGFMRTRLREAIADTQRQISSVQSRIGQAEKIAARFKTKAGTNLLRDLVEERLRALRAAVAAGDSHIETVKRAQQLIKDQSFEVDAAPAKRDVAFTFVIGGDAGWPSAIKTQGKTRFGG